MDLPNTMVFPPNPFNLQEPARSPFDMANLRPRRRRSRVAFGTAAKALLRDYFETGRWQYTTAPTTSPATSTAHNTTTTTFNGGGNDGSGGFTSSDYYATSGSIFLVHDGSGGASKAAAAGDMASPLGFFSSSSSSFSSSAAAAAEVKNYSASSYLGANGALVFRRRMSGLALHGSMLASPTRPLARATLVLPLLNFRRRESAHLSGGGGGDGSDGIGGVSAAISGHHCPGASIFASLLLAGPGTDADFLPVPAIVQPAAGVVASAGPLSGLIQAHLHPTQAGMAPAAAARIVVSLGPLRLGAEGSVIATDSDGNSTSNFLSSSSGDHYNDDYYGVYSSRAAADAFELNSLNWRLVYSENGHRASTGQPECVEAAASFEEMGRTFCLSYCYQTTNLIGVQPQSYWRSMALACIFTRRLSPDGDAGKSTLECGGLLQLGPTSVLKARADTSGRVALALGLRLGGVGGDDGIRGAKSGGGGGSSGDIYNTKIDTMTTTPWLEKESSERTATESASTIASPPATAVAAAKTASKIAAGLVRPVAKVAAAVASGGVAPVTLVLTAAATPGAGVERCSLGLSVCVGESN